MRVTVESGLILGLADEVLTTLGVVTVITLLLLRSEPRGVALDYDLIGSSFLEIIFVGVVN